MATALLTTGPRSIGEFYIETEILLTHCNDHEYGVGPFSIPDSCQLVRYSTHFSIPVHFTVDGVEAEDDVACKAGEWDWINF